MELINALRLDQTARPPRVAFVGAGGKTTAIFQCARQLIGPVLVTATTHLAAHQLKLADQHYFVDDLILDRLKSELPSGITLLTGPLDRDSNRTLGLPADQLESVFSLAEARQIPLLIEADGSRQRPLKAPADHEPPIPGFVDLVVNLASLSGLGTSLTPSWVHRPEIFASLSGLQPGEIITPMALAKIMTHSDGGLKNIPPSARRIALLNQADTPELQAKAIELKSLLLPVFDAVIVSSLTQNSPIFAVHEPIAAVILAAGEARRFGSPKQLLEWHGRPLIWHVAKRALQAELSPVIIVTGAETGAIHQAVMDLPVQIIHNPDWQQGQGTSVKLGAGAVSSRSGGILFLLADQPQIPIPLIRALIDAHAQKRNPITGPLIDGQRGNPVLFDRVTFTDLDSLAGEAGGRQLFSKYPVDWIPWYDPVPLLDVDTPEDYARLLEMGP